MKKQKDIFLQSEADRWVIRNRKNLALINWSLDPVVCEIERLIELEGIKRRKKVLRVLEIGCGDGSRGEYVMERLGCDYFGIDPSNYGTDIALSKGVKASVGTADDLPYEDNFFDVLIYGFCLYLCDQEDHGQISKEAARVLKDDSWLLIFDFYSPQLYTKEYHHKKGVKTLKMDFRNLFRDLPEFTCIYHRVMDHDTHEFSDITDNWVAISVLRKYSAGE